MENSSERIHEKRDDHAKQWVLVIDDEAGFRSLYRFILEPLGYLVEAAEDGRQGLELAAGKCYDLVVLDMHMPNMNGLEVLKGIRGVRPEQKVIICSSNSDSSHVLERQAKDLGALDCLYKPMDMKDMVAAIELAFATPPAP